MDDLVSSDSTTDEEEEAAPDAPPQEVCLPEDELEAAVFNPLIEHAELCVGHKVNHPPHGVSPNVHVMPLDVGYDEHVALHPYLAVVHAQPPLSDGVRSKRTAVLVASRALSPHFGR